MKMLSSFVVGSPIENKEKPAVIYVIVPSVKHFALVMAPICEQDSPGKPQQQHTIALPVPK